MDAIEGTRARLAADRTRGLGFEESWAAALAEVRELGRSSDDARSALIALEATEAVWRASYCRDPAMPSTTPWGRLETTLDDPGADLIERARLLG